MEKDSIVIAADHNGVELKAHIKVHLKELGYNCVDLGPYTGGKKVDYVDYANQVGEIVNQGDVKKGILICGTGVGMSIVVNKFPNVRGALVHNVDTSIKSREHNDSNVLCFGSWVINKELAVKIVDSWLNGSFSEGRHVKRLEKIVPHSKEKIIFTNGIFDVLHTGHIELLKFCKSLGGMLIVGINSDRAVKELKGPGKLINNEEDRKMVLESVGFVDEVVTFDDIGTKSIIDEIKPNIVVKGGDWTAEEVRKRDNIPDDIEVKVFPFVDDISTINNKVLNLRK